MSRQIPKQLARFALCLFLLTLGLYLTLVLLLNTTTLIDKVQILSTTFSRAAQLNVEVRTVTGCQDRPRETRVQPRGDYVVYYNILPARREFGCHESITLTTQGDFTFLDNLVPLVERWRGPISVALYAPGDDFQPTVDSIAYLRHCRNHLIKEFVTFHVFYERRHYPKNITSGTQHLAVSLQNADYDCLGKRAPFADISHSSLYRTKNSLAYPINVARNIALESAQTHFVFASDIELLPSVGIIDKFLHMVATKPYLEPVVNFTNKHVYALAVFEVQEKSKVPRTKSELQEMYYDTEEVFFFHEKLCILCHGIPRRDDWMQQLDDDDLDVFAAVKRKGEHRRWEPFYIGTHREPPFDERVTWEGSSNKMIQAFTLCSLDYDIRVLDNVFLIHKPGISKGTSQVRQDRIEMSNLIRETIVPELQNIYGKRRGCIVGGEFTQIEI